MYLSNLDPLGNSDALPLRDRRSLSDKFLFVFQDDSVRFIAESCIHVLDRTNRMLGTDIYRWRCTDASKLNEAEALNCAPDQVLVLIGRMDQAWRPKATDLPIFRSAIRNAARVCVIGGAVFLPPATGVLGPKRLAVHSVFQAALRETCPTIEMFEDATCHHNALSSATGPVAAMQMILDLVGAREGNFTRSALSQDLGLRENNEEYQKVGSSERWRLQRRAEGCEVISDALQIMEDHLEDTLSVAQIAEIIGVSARKLERSFSEKLGRSPLKVYRDLRLERAHDLMTQTALPLNEVSVACGFSNVTLMKRWFSMKYGEVPCETRRQAFLGLQ